MKLMTLRSYGYHVSALPLLLFICSTLKSMSSGSAVPGLPSSVPVGTIFTLAHALWLQSQNEEFQLDLRFWVDAGVDQCMGGVRYTFMTPNALIYSFNSIPKPWVGTNCTVEFRNDGVLAFALNVNGSSPPVVVWQTPTSGSHAKTLTLQDDGNLVLLDAAGAIVWQSFGSFDDVLMVPTGMKFFHNTTLSDRVSVYSDFSIPGCYAARLSQQGRILLFTRANMFVYYSLGLNESMQVANYIIIQQDIEFYNDGSTLIGSIAHNVLDNDPLPNGTDLIGSAHFNDANFVVERASLSNPSEHLLYYNSSISSYCDHPLVCGEYGLCNEATRQCNCPMGFKMATDNPTCNIQNEATKKCSCPEEFQMPKFISTCVASDAAYSLQPINVSFHSQPSAVSMGSQDECRDLCAQNASCNAALFESSSSSCALFPILYTIALPPQGISTGQVMFLKITSADEKKSKSTVVIISTTVVATAVALILLCLLAWKWWLRKRHIQKTQERFLQELSKLPPRFSYKDLQVATNDFSKKLAVGGFGSVFEGVMNTSNGVMKVAIKRLEQVGNTRDDQFKAEVATIGSVSHVNLVSLKGFCMERNARLLVLEFMTRGSLDKWLYDQRERQLSDVDQAESSNSSSLLQDTRALAAPSPELPSVVLDWEKRCQIALDTAKGLEYLHHLSAEHIVHCDVKPANILLDEDFHAKVADFGLAKLMVGSDTRSFAMTTLKGTRGYLAPEWLQEATITAKSDVYSYGVVLLELLTGRRCLDVERGHLPIWAMKMVAATLYSAGSTSSSSTMKNSAFIISSSDATSLQSIIMDERLHTSDVPTESFVHMLKLALSCVQADPADRPSMASVVQMLEGMTEVPYSLQGLKLSQSTQFSYEVASGLDSSTSYTTFSGVISASNQMLSEGR